eukprot:TRINITY_DN51808_c0_g1_i1.p1 TRINITY_DN51808_c0_g1~~TRINITY_DN51808_c0_g1_i1.p1  ORF type:complete len:390 (+),score=73.47 TRINITY_DN51808_c0_g1_i1:84-1253(+)
METVSHTHASTAASQNLGNSLGSRPCVRQTSLYRRHESGNAMKAILGVSHLAWQQGKRCQGRCQGRGTLDFDGQTHHRQADENAVVQAETPPPKSVTVHEGGYPSGMTPPKIMSHAASSSCLGAQLAQKDMAATLVPEILQMVGSGSVPPSARKVQQAGSASASEASKLSRSRFDAQEVAAAFGTRGDARQNRTGGRPHFVEEYRRGALPCRIDHRTCSYRVSWDIPIEEVCSQRKVLMPIFANGLRESQHPYASLARLAFKCLAELPGVEPLPSSSQREVMAALRLALSQPSREKRTPSVPSASRSSGHTPDDVFFAALAALKQVAEAEGSHLVPHLGLVLPALGKRLFSRNACERDAVKDVLQQLANKGGPEAVKAIWARGVGAGLS